jgi:glycosyltransferase involved in cell wall biosynthesis
MLNTFELILFLIFCFALTIQLIYYWLIFARFAFYKLPTELNNEKPPVSVIIAARNEYHNLSKYLQNILEQDYPEFEVVVVNHASNDETVDYLKEIRPKYPHLKVVNIERELNFFTGKKFPLSLGIKSAKYDLLLLTDADCETISSNWISSVVKQYGSDTEIVLGYGPYKKSDGFLNKVIRYDTFFTAMQYLSFALAGLPYMGVGRNLSYRRTMFFRNKGFTSHYKIISGDDDLFINKVANRKNTSIVIDPESFMYSDAKSNYQDWIRQKFRHMSAGKYYKPKFKWLLGLFGFTHILFYISFIILLIFWVIPLITISLFVIRFVTQLVIHRFVLSKLQEKKLFLFTLFWDIVHIFIVHTVTLLSIFRKRDTWN